MSLSNTIRVVQLFESYPLFYQPYIPPVIAALGQEQSLELRINAFKGTADNGVEILPSYYKRKLKEKFYALRHNTKLNYAEIQYIKQGVDVVHLQHSFLFSKVKGLLALPNNERPKIIITLRGGDTYVKPWLSEKWQDFYANYGNLVDGFITMSQHQKQYLNEKWGINPNKIHVIPISCVNPPEIQAKYPNSNTIKIVSAFRMCWEKNINGNLKVIKYLKDKGINVQYHIYGSGPDAGQLMFLIDKYKLQNNVTYHGKVENTRLKSKLHNSDIYLQLSHSESLGMSVIEAQACGLPAIVSNSGGLPEVIIDKESGYCVGTHETERAAEYIYELWKNKETYKVFSAKAIENSQGFSVDVEVDKLTALYKKITQL